MKPPVHYSKSQMVSIVIDAIATVCPGAVAIDTDTCLLGSQGILDSVGLVTLFVTLEQNLGNSVDLATSFMEQEDVEEEHNPFRTVGSLADHIHQLATGGA